MAEYHWVRSIADEVLSRGDEEIVIHTGKTPSGPIHIGAEREQFICSALQRELERRGFQSQFNFIIDSFDPIKSIPAGLEVPKDFGDQIGKPLSDVPDPFGCHASYAHHFADEFIGCQGRLGLYPNVIYSHELYMKKEMKDAIRTVLARLGELREIRRKYIQGDEEVNSGTDDWNPVMVVCERCGKIASKKKEVAPNKVDSWDLQRDEVTYRCVACGHEGKGKISDVRLKLSWRVDWTAKWAIFKVSCEPAGKDHCVKDGAYDMGIEVCQKIFGYRGPLRVPYEWLTLGEHAMKTHKGITFTPLEWLRVAPPEALRYLILSVDPMRHISFLPDRIPDIVDNLDRLERIRFRAEAPSGTESQEFLDDLYRICVVGEMPSSLPARLPYRFAVTTVQLGSILGEDKVISKSISYTEKLNNRQSLSDKEVSDLKSRLEMARNWVGSYAPPSLKFKISLEAPSIKASPGAEQKFVESVIALVRSDLGEAELQNAVFESAKSLGLDLGKAFKLIYMALLGSERGPRLAPLLIALDREWAVSKLKAVL
ncbi:MAG: lysine--tRNA ligase [Candidatus Methanomethylicia archaeon]|nr:lysine--tRNA ligase [Candidatus Methanomethylicia archaeon]